MLAHPRMGQAQHFLDVRVREGITPVGKKFTVLPHNSQKIKRLHDRLRWNALDNGIPPPAHGWKTEIRRGRE
jgi:hypothetical protein